MITALQVPNNKVGVAPGTTTIQLGDCSPAMAQKQARAMNKIATFTTAAVKRAARWFNPYGTMEDLRGMYRVPGRRPPLGLVLNNEPIMAGKDYPYACGDYDKQYHQYGEPGLFYDTSLGGTPTDLQLSRVFGWMPFVQGYASSRPQLAGPVGEIVPAEGAPTAPAAPFDAGQAAVAELKRHQDRQFALSVVSTLAIASTAMIGIFKHLQEQRMAKRNRTSSTAAKPLSPVNPVAGHRGRVRRRGRR